MVFYGLVSTRNSHFIVSALHKQVESSTSVRALNIYGDTPAGNYWALSLGTPAPTTRTLGSVWLSHCQIAYTICNANISWKFPASSSPYHIFQPEPIDIDFFNPDYFNLKPIGGAYHINKRHTRIYILFFRSFWKFEVGEDSRVLFYYFAVLYLLYLILTILNIYYTLLFFNIIILYYSTIIVL